MKQVEVREGAKRQHRTITLFAVIQCWIKKTDGIIFERAQLLRLLGLSQFKDTRVKWMKRDFKHLFQYQRTLPVGSLHSLSHLIVCRRPIESFFPNEETNPKKIIELSTANGVNLDFFSMWPKRKASDLKDLFEGTIPFFADSVNYDERLMSAFLALLIQGQISPLSIPGLSGNDGALQNKQAAA